jgi:WD40 repeat protein
VHVWDVKGSPRIVLKLDMPGGGSVNGLRFSDDGRFLAAANGGGPDSHLFRIWKASTGSLFRDVADPYSDGGPLITVGFDFLGAGGQMARVQTNPPIGRPPASSGESLRVADTITQVTAWESTLSDRADKLWRNRASNRVAVAEWKRVVQEGRPRIQPKILIVDAIERKGIANFDVLDFGCSVTYASWSDDGSRLALGGTIVGDEARRLTGPTVQIWDAATQTLLNEFSYKKGFHLLGLLGAPQDKFMVVAWDDAVEIRSGDGSAVEQTIRAKPSAIALSADGQQLAIAETDRRISVWNVKKRRH